MSVAERIETLEYLVPREYSVSRSGYDDDPNYWLAQLYEVQGDFPRATALIRGLIEETADPPVLWLQLYKSILEKSGGDAAVLAKTNALLEQRLRTQ
jgi:hypothetical protein